MTPQRLLGVIAILLTAMAIAGVGPAVLLSVAVLLVAVAVSL